jgi:hypothetical protein
MLRSKLHGFVSDFAIAVRLFRGSFVQCRQEAIMKRNVRWAVICSVAAIVILVLGFQLTAGPVDRAAESFGRLVGLATCAGLLCGWLASRAKRPWGLPRFAAVYGAVFAIGLILSGRASMESVAATADSPGFSVTWPSGWTVQRLEGVSSAESDRAMGWRERGLLGDATAPKAAIEVTCAVKPNHPVSNSDSIADILAAISKGYESNGFHVSASVPAKKHMGVHDGETVEITAARDGAQLRQVISVAQNEHCLLSATFTAKAADYDAHVAAYSAVLESLR